MRERKECITEGCTKTSKSRGLCVDCYGAATYAIRAKKTTWELLVRTGLALEARRVKSTFRAGLDKVQAGPPEDFAANAPKNEVCQIPGSGIPFEGKLPAPPEPLKEAMVEKVMLDSQFEMPATSHPQAVFELQPHAKPTQEQGLYEMDADYRERRKAWHKANPSADPAQTITQELDNEYAAPHLGPEITPNGRPRSCPNDCVDDCDTCEKSDCGGHGSEEPPEESRRSRMEPEPSEAGALKQPESNMPQERMTEPPAPPCDPDMDGDDDFLDPLRPQDEGEPPEVAFPNTEPGPLSEPIVIKREQPEGNYETDMKNLAAPPVAPKKLPWETKE